MKRKGRGRKEGRGRLAGLSSDEEVKEVLAGGAWRPVGVGGRRQRKCDAVCPSVGHDWGTGAEDMLGRVSR